MSHDVDVSKFQGLKDEIPEVEDLCERVGKVQGLNCNY